MNCWGWRKEVSGGGEWRVSEASTEEMRRKALEAMKADPKSRIVDEIGIMSENEVKEVLGRL